MKDKVHIDLKITPEKWLQASNSHVINSIEKFNLLAVFDSVR